MLGSVDQDHEGSSSSDLHYQPQVVQIPPPPPAIHLHRLLLTCAELISQANFSAARHLISVLSSNSSPYGDATERLVHHFTMALSLRITRQLNPNVNVNVTLYNYNTIQSCYLSLNQITPFIRFSHLTANQAILEAVELNQQVIHILDFDIMHGVQWPPLMQAIAERTNPPMLRITATGNDLNVLHRTGDRLSTFAESLNLRFRFHPILTLNDDVIPTEFEFNLLPNESLAVNCVFYLHKLNSRDLRVFLRRIKSMNPKVVTIAEREANHSNPLFLQRFVEALDHYTPIFHSLEATLPPNSRERIAVEQVWFGREIMDIVAADGEKRRERHERFESWQRVLRSLGFENLPLSGFALSQAKLLLRLHYPSEGYQLQVINDSFFLAWQNRPLFSISSWH
ncbi:hypothetical protein ACFE04_023182 [Oxalis oulophora]